MMRDVVGAVLIWLGVAGLLFTLFGDRDDRFDATAALTWPIFLAMLIIGETVVVLAWLVEQIGDLIFPRSDA